MSPQQLEGLLPRPTDDLYSVGALLYELLTSRPPFIAGDRAYHAAHVAVRPLDERQAELRVTNPVPEQVIETIAACLAKEPRKRPQSAVELVQRLGLATAASRTEGQMPAPRHQLGERLGALGLAVLDWGQRRWGGGRRRGVRRWAPGRFP